MRGQILVAILIVFSSVLQAQQRYPIEVQITSMNSVVTGTETSTTQLKCESTTVGTDTDTRCKGGHTVNTAVSQLHYSAVLSNEPDAVYDLVCLGDSWSISCSVLEAGQKYMARWKEKSWNFPVPTLAVAFPDKKGKVKELLVSAKKVAVTPKQAPERMGVCNVTSSPEHANLTVDGAFVGQTPAELRLAAGKHHIELSSKGYRSVVQDITALEQSRVNLNVILEKE